MTDQKEDNKRAKPVADSVIPAAKPLRAPFWLVAADAFVYWAALYQCVLITLLFREGVVPGWVRYSGYALCAVVLMLGAAHRRYMAGGWARAAVLDSLVFIFIGAWLPWKFSGVHTAKGLSFLWAAIEWWKLPGNIGLMFRTAPIEFVLFWAVVLLILFRISRGSKVDVIGVLVGFAIFYSIKLAGTEAGVRLPAYLFFDAALLIAAFAAWKGWTRTAARIVAIDATFIIIFLFYLGLIPVFGGSPPGASAGVERIYPAAGNTAGFPLVFLRDMHVDPRAGYLYTAYGPTSGIVRVKLDTGRADIIRNSGIVRFLWTTPEMDELYALDWMYADFYRIGKKDFRIRKKTNLYDGLLVTPMSYVVNGGKLYVVSTDYPALTRYDLATMKREAAINFRQAGVTKFRSGAWKSALDAERGKLFVELGPVDIKGRYAVARVDLESFRVEATGYLPEGGLELLYVKEKGAVYAPSFFSTRIYEIDAETLKVRRVLEGPLTCRNMVYDAGRDVFYAASYTRGELFFIDAAGGKTIAKIRSGKKTSSLFYEPVADTVYFGGGAGIFKLDPKRFVRGERK